jgi:hypothetical protein
MAVLRPKTGITFEHHRELAPIKLLYSSLACAFLWGHVHAQTVGGSQSRLSQQRALAVEVESLTHIDGFNLRSATVNMDAGALLSLYDGAKKNGVHQTYWIDVPAGMRDTFATWAATTPDYTTGEALYEDLFFRFFFLHEFGHWANEQVVSQRHDAKAKRARRNFERNKWEDELNANRLAVAWWRERDPAFLDRLLKSVRLILATLPSPVPAGQDDREYFSRNLWELVKDPNKYGWYQLRMIIIAYEESPRLSFQQTIDRLPHDNYDL